MYNSFNSSTDGGKICIFMTLISLVFGVLKKMLVVHKLHRDACIENTVLIPLDTVLYVSLVESWTAHADPEMHTHQGKSHVSLRHLRYSILCLFHIHIDHRKDG